MLNTLFKDSKLLISDKCEMLIKELETHYYKEGGRKDGEVVKERDDLIDALRYLIFMIKKNNNKNSKVAIDKFKNKYKKDINKQFRHL
jgi:hypothetical protein